MLVFEFASSEMQSVCRLKDARYIIISGEATYMDSARMLFG